MSKIYCSICGKNIKKCTCKRPIPVETKVTQPKEIKKEPKVETKTGK